MSGDNDFRRDIAKETKLLAILLGGTGKKT
jgi:hypothetical protein